MKVNSNDNISPLHNENDTGKITNEYKCFMELCKFFNLSDNTYELYSPTFTTVNTFSNKKKLFLIIIASILGIIIIFFFNKIFQKKIKVNKLWVRVTNKILLIT